MADLVITAANVLASASATVETGTAGANITAGQALYKDTTDSNKLKLGQATASKATFAGISLHAAYTGQPIDYVTKDTDFTTGNATVAVGGVYTLSDTAGGIRPHADNDSADYVTIVGIGISTTKIKVLSDQHLRSDGPMA